MMDPDDDEQVMRAVCVGIAAISGQTSTETGLFSLADSIGRYIENGAYDG